MVPGKGIGKRTLRGFSLEQLVPHPACSTSSYIKVKLGMAVQR